jgi:dTMP kinase
LRGAFITLEGIEGVGKSTSLELVADVLRAAGHAPQVTREPGGTPLGEQVREWILHAEHGRLTPETETLLMFAARAEHIADVIRPALRRGTWVVCDRFTDATYAYQGAGRGAKRELLDALADGVQGTLTPDLTLLLDAPVDVGLGRIRGREHDHFEKEQRAFFERVRQAYLTLCEAEPARIRRIDAAGGLAGVRAQIEAELDAFLSRFEATDER